MTATVTALAAATTCKLAEAADKAAGRQDGFWDIDTATSYATGKNLLKALAKHGLAESRFMVVRNRAGRYTAIFSLSQNGFDGGYIGIYSQFGFKTFA